MNTARRQSNALSVGSTPLNKVITIILAAQKTSPTYVAQALDEVISRNLSFQQKSTILESNFQNISRIFAQMFKEEQRSNSRFWKSFKAQIQPICLPRKWRKDN